MNSLLAKHAPKGMEKDKWKTSWEASHSTLQPLADVLKEMFNREASVRPDDFDCPNHYAKLVAEEVRKQVLKDIMALLPEACLK